MNEEQTSILQMVAEGKISAEEAERLLNVLKAQPQQKAASSRRIERGERTRRGRGSRWRSFEGPVDVSGYEWLVIENESASVSVEGVDGTMMEMKSSGRAKFRLEDEAIYVWGGRERVHLGVPADLRSIQARVLGADFKGRHLFGDLDLSVPGGSVDLSDVRPGRIHVRCPGGCIVCILDVVSEGEVDLSTPGGDTILRLSEESTCAISGSAVQGDIYLDLPLELEDDHPEHFRGTLHGGGTQIVLKAPGGSIRVEAIGADEEQATVPSQSDHCPECHQDYGPDKDHCPECHATYGTEENHCPECHQTYGPEKGHCPECHATYGTEENHCPECHQTYSPEKEHCPECHQTYGPDQDHCSECHVSYPMGTTHSH